MKEKNSCPILTLISTLAFSVEMTSSYLSAPSETFVFKSVMQWIKCKKEERMPFAAKVIGAVHLGLLDIREMIRELSPEEMQQVPEIHDHTLLYESLLYSYIPSSSTFSEENAKIRSTVPVRIILHLASFV